MRLGTLDRHSQELAQAPTPTRVAHLAHPPHRAPIMAIAAAHLAASSTAPKFACTRSPAAVSRAALSSASFAPLAARTSRFSGASRITARSANRNGSARVRLLPIRAAASEEAGEEFIKQAEEVFNELKAKWNRVGNKTSVAIYGSGALVALWFSSTVVNTVNTVPLLPNFMELIGLGYSAWFVYRYLLFQDNRKELAAEIKELKRKITGVADDISS
ncbi:hypothetical protein M758_10G153900 [Ceratodon purpureus]|nr:hypothetical protein M758_10G153900 [Ceratodon purpureus]